VLPVCADFTEPFDVPEPAASFEREVVYFPGSTIGNFDPQGASRLLAGIAELLEDAGSRLKFKVARLGGDEFGLLARATSISEARARVETLREVLGGALEIDDLRIDIETNVGITVFPDQGGDAETLLHPRGLGDFRVFVARTS